MSQGLKTNNNKASDIKGRPGLEETERNVMTTTSRTLVRSLLGATALGLVLGCGQALAADPIKIGVIAEAQAIAGASIPQAAQLAADEINAKGGVDGRKIEIVSYDNHSSSADRSEEHTSELQSLV